MFAGIFISVLMYFFANKSVYKIILLKGGKSVYIETFGMFGSGLKRVFKLDEITSNISRQSSRGYIPISYKGVWLKLIVDVQGHFLDPLLFDMTAGLKRDLKANVKRK